MQFIQKLGKQIVYSEKFQDIYWSGEGGLAEKEYVFLNGNSLIERWKEEKDFTIFELGFGAGLNFLTTWKAWKNSGSKNYLHFISTEAFPIPKALLVEILLDFSEISDFSKEWISLYEDWTPGVHSIFFEKDRLRLTLWIGDGLDCLKNLSFYADAFYLDGFSPSKNPELWSKEIFENIKKHVNGYASFSTYSVSKSVKENAQDSGFKIEVLKGFGKKKGMLVGEISLNNNYINLKRFYPIPSINKQTTEITILGAGLAGLSLGYFFAKKNIKAEFIDLASDIGENASANPMGYFGPKLSKEPTIASRLSLAGTEFTTRMLSIWKEEFNFEVGKDTGIFQILNKEEEEILLDSIKSHNLTDEYYKALEKRISFSQKEYSFKGIHIKKGGFFYPLDFSKAVYLFLKEKGSSFKWNSRVSRIHQSDVWELYDDSGQLLKRTKYLFLCNSFYLNQFEMTRDLPIQKIRGQIAYLNSQFDFDSLSLPIIFDDTYFLSDPEKKILGATFNPKDENEFLNPEHNVLLLQRLSKYFPEVQAEGGKILDGRVGFRANTKDRLPVLGSIPIIEYYKKNYKNFQKGYSDEKYPNGNVYENLYVLSAMGSKGITYAPLLAFTLVSILLKEPSPLPSDILEGLHPARFIMRDILAKRV